MFIFIGFSHHVVILSVISFSGCNAAFHTEMKERKDGVTPSDSLCCSVSSDHPQQTVGIEIKFYPEGQTDRRPSAIFVVVYIRMRRWRLGLYSVTDLISPHRSLCVCVWGMEASLREEEKLNQLCINMK